MDVYCYAEKIPSMRDDYYYRPCTNAFAGSYIEYATLHVPPALVNDYKQTEPWKNFGTIVATDGDAPEDPEVPEEPVDGTDETVTVSSALVAGFSSNKAFDFTSLESEGVTAWVATGFRGGNVLLSRVYAVPTGEGVYVKAEKAGTYEIPTTTEDSYYMNMFVGVPDGKTVDQYEDFYGETFLTLSFALSQSTGKPGFFPNTAPKTYGKNKMYLHMPVRLLPEYAKARIDDFSLGIEFEDETTGISDASHLNDNGQMINDNRSNEDCKSPITYNLNGQRLASPRKGLNIINGSKVVIK